jgi:NAD(P)H-nitrite reductase large subunit
MNDDDEICLCFHVTQHKVMQYIRIEKPKLPSQLSNCYGAGTGCGWCRPFLKRLLEQCHASQSKINDSDNSNASPTAKDYAASWEKYRQESQGTQKRT